MVSNVAAQFEFTYAPKQNQDGIYWSPPLISCGTSIGCDVLFPSIRERVWVTFKCNISSADPYTQQCEGFQTGGGIDREDCTPRFNDVELGTAYGRVVELTDAFGDPMFPPEYAIVYYLAGVAATITSPDLFVQPKYMVTFTLNNPTVKPPLPTTFAELDALVISGIASYAETYFPNLSWQSSGFGTLFFPMLMLSLKDAAGKAHPCAPIRYCRSEPSFFPPIP
jgi:hypothetical protein